MNLRLVTNASNSTDATPLLAASNLRFSVLAMSVRMFTSACEYNTKFKQITVRNRHEELSNGSQRQRTSMELQSLLACASSALADAHSSSYICVSCVARV